MAHSTRQYQMVCCQQSPSDTRLYSYVRVCGLKIRKAQRVRQLPRHCSAENGDSLTSGSPGADLAAAWQLLKSFTEAEIRRNARQYVKDSSSRAKLRVALLLAYHTPSLEESWNPALNPDVLLGIVASEGRLAVRALRDWCEALELEYVQPDCKVMGAASLAAVKGAVYIKYNATSKVCYLTQYQGTDRGVLVQLGQGKLLGHFPLGLFDEQMQNQPPSVGLHTTPEPEPSSFYIA